MIKMIRRGDIFFADLVGIGSQQKGRRPVVVVSNNAQNDKSDTINVVPLSTSARELLVHIKIDGCGLRKTSYALVEQVTTINKNQIVESFGKTGKLSSAYLNLLDDAIDIQFGRRDRTGEALRKHIAEKKNKANIGESIWGKSILES